jgi:2Fe-2S ferredoxin
MPTVMATDRDNQTHRIEGKDGSTLKDVLVTQGKLDIAASCGGFAMCGTCHIYVDVAWLDRVGPRNDNEETMLCGFQHVKRNSRLACQHTLTRALSGIQLTLAPKE